MRIHKDKSKERSQKPETADVWAQGVKNLLDEMYLYISNSCPIGSAAGH